MKKGKTAVQAKISALCGDDAACTETLICKPDQNQQTLFDHAIAAGSLDTLYDLWEAIELNNCDQTKYTYSPIIAEVEFYKTIKKDVDQKTKKLEETEKTRAYYQAQINHHEQKIRELLEKKLSILNETTPVLDTSEIEKIRLKEIIDLRQVRIKNLQEQIKRLETDLKKYLNHTFFGINLHKYNTIRSNIKKLVSEILNTHETTISEKYKNEIDKKVTEEDLKARKTQAIKIEHEIIEEREKATEARIAESNALTEQGKILSILQELELAKKEKETAIEREVQLLATLASAPNQQLQDFKKAIDSICHGDEACEKEYVCKQSDKGTMLHNAAKSGSLDMVVSVLEMGAEDCRDAKDGDNQTAVDVAQSPRIKLFLNDPISTPIWRYLKDKNLLFKKPRQISTQPEVKKENVAMTFEKKRHLKSMTPTNLDQELMNIIDRSDFTNLEPYLQKIKKNAWDGKIKVKQGPNTYDINLLEYVIWRSTTNQPKELIERLLTAGLRINNTKGLFFNDLILSHLPVFSIRFNNIELLEKLKDSHPELSHFREILCEIFNGFTPALLLQNKSLVEGIISRLAQKQEYSQVKCDNWESPLSLAVNSGSDLILPVIKKIIHAHCQDTSYSECTKTLVCSKYSQKETLLHKAISMRAITESTSVLEYIWEIGGKDCFGDKNSLGKTPLVLAKNNKLKKHEDFIKTVQPSYFLPGFEKLIPEELIKFYEVPSSEIFSLRHPYNRVIHTQINNTILVSLPLLSCFLTLFILYSMFLGSGKKQVSRKKSYLEILLEDISPTTPGPEKHSGSLNNKDLEELNKDKSTREFVGSVNAVPPPNHHLKASSEHKTIEIKRALPFKPLAQDRYDYNHGKKINKVLFYIPGTAFYIENTAIDTCIVTHLSHALEMPVVCTTHRLGSTTEAWPGNLNDVCKTIEEYCKEYEPNEIRIAGYSAGGLLSVLAGLIVSRLSITIDEIILFFPLLDLCGEFRDGLDRVINFIPEKLRDQKGKLTSACEATEKDRIFDGGHKHGTPFKNAIVYGFSEEHRTPLTKLRRYSPAWFQPSVFQDKNFPKNIRIITGKTDYFYPETEIFCAILESAGKVVTKIVLEEDHKAMWDHLYPIYLVNFTTQGFTKEEHLQKPGSKIEELQDKLKTKNPKKDQDILDESKELKELCKNSASFYSMTPKKTIKTTTKLKKN